MRWPGWSSRTDDSRALSVYWDDVVGVTTITPVPPPDAPPDLTQIVRHLQMAEAADHSRPLYEERLLQRLLTNQQETIAMQPTAATLPALSQPPMGKLPTRASPHPRDIW